MVEVDEEVREPHGRAEIIQDMAKAVAKSGAKWDDSHGVGGGGGWGGG